MTWWARVRSPRLPTDRKNGPGDSSARSPGSTPPTKSPGCTRSSWPSGSPGSTKRSRSSRRSSGRRPGRPRDRRPHPIGHRHSGVASERVDGIELRRRHAHVQRDRRIVRPERRAPARSARGRRVGHDDLPRGSVTTHRRASRSGRCLVNESLGAPRVGPCPRHPAPDVYLASRARRSASTRLDHFGVEGESRD